MTKENETKKILLVLNRVIKHIILDYESLMKKDRETLIYELQEVKEEESKRIAVDHQKSNNVNSYIVAWEKIKAARDFANMMLEGFNIKDEFDVYHREIRQKEAEALDKLLSEQFDEDAELEKLID